MPKSSTAQTAITPFILCGGSGTRLWPLSRESFPKQFVSGKSLLQPMLERVRCLGERLMFVTAEGHRFLISAAFPALSNRVKIWLAI